MERRGKYSNDCGGYKYSNHGAGGESIRMIAEGRNIRIIDGRECSNTCGGIGIFE